MTRTQRPKDYWKTRLPYTKQWLKEHAQEQKEWWAEYRKKNREKIRADQKAYRERHKNEPEYKLRKNLRERLRAALRGLAKSKSTMLLIGCTVDELKNHLQKQFKPNMTWENYGSEWHIDHIIPCSKFDLLTLDAQMKCFHYTNLQPLWAEENISKGNRLTI